MTADSVRVIAMDLDTRILAALDLLAQVPRLPDVGRHHVDCHRRHPDCLADRIEKILRGETP